MIVSDLLAACQGSSLTDEVEIDLSGISIAILSAQTSGGKLSITASTAHTLAMIHAKTESVAAAASLASAQSGWAAAKVQLQAMINKRVADYVSKDLLHIPPRGPDEAALMDGIKKGEL